MSASGLVLSLPDRKTVERIRRTLVDRTSSDLPLDLKLQKEQGQKPLLSFRSNMMQCSLHAHSQQVLHKASLLWQKPLSISVCCQPPGARHFNSISSRKRQILLPDLCRQRALSPAAMSKQDSAADSQKVNVLFVCWGNICRSPTAEAMFSTVVQRAGLADKFDIDSCGTGGGQPNWYKKGGYSNHTGHPADERMTEAASKRGVVLTSRSRPLEPSDLASFDYLVGMDDSNLKDMRIAVEYWEHNGAPIPKGWGIKLKKMSDFIRNPKFKQYDEVPDPYYSSGPAGFELVLDLLDDACTGFLDSICEESPKLRAA